MPWVQILPGPPLTPFDRSSGVKPYERSSAPLRGARKYPQRDFRGEAQYLVRVSGPHRHLAVLRDNPRYRRRSRAPLWDSTSRLSGRMSWVVRENATSRCQDPVELIFRRKRQRVGRMSLTAWPGMCRIILNARSNYTCHKVRPSFVPI